jgi:hypothetical protein
MIEIVCYAGGTCGDLLCGMLDSKDAVFARGTVSHNRARLALKKPHQFDNDEQKDQYLEDVGKLYDSVPSHDLQYHVKRNHKFITISVSDMNTAIHAATRFKNLHRPHVWDEMQRACGAATVEAYAQILIDFSNLARTYSQRTVALEDILKGNAVEQLENCIQRPISKKSTEFYLNWLDLQSGTFVI